MLATNRLLIVDDEAGITRVIEAAARDLGFEVLAIHDSDQFEKALGRIKPTIIFLDIAMPGRDGMELIGYLAAGKYSGKVVVMSGSDPRYIQMSSTIAKTRGLMLAGMLAKPFRKQEVTDLLNSLAIGETAQEPNMQPLVYDVVLHGDEWRFVHGDTVSVGYPSRSAAIHAAEAYTLQAGRTVHIRVFRVDGTIDEERVFIRASDQYLNDKTDQISPLQRSHSNDP
jgi:DNA-binding response OmpR family regulator